VLQILDGRFHESYAISYVIGFELRRRHVRFLDVMRGSIPMIYPSRAQVYQDNAAAWSTCNPSEKS
jgi:hypothetical protein